MKMSEVHAEIERFVRPMPLEDYRQQVGKHLDLIEVGAEMAARHASMMVQKPGFETKAQDELNRAREVLEAALANVIAAQATYASKPMEVSHAG